MQMTVTITGAQELAATLRSLPEAVEKKVVSAALRKAGEPIRVETAHRMTRSAHPHPARVQKSGRGGVAGRRGAIGASHAADHVVLEVGRSGFALTVGPADLWWYWLFVEFGTKHIAARPALRPAFDSKSQVALRIMMDEFWKAIEKKTGQRSRFATGGARGAGGSVTETFL